ncbi:redox-sensing transcriptional repressor [Acetitomaculum ruminis DSM 5522]|uniref:Redox-sensing transcriptional repressor Rex n=1 Tax=Acetitomaculum ruminis DSM 5522 TaxID=1120918 RepID=A0A1I0V7A4_9FIRM|nr:redox-sensing transcriptional repressor Rex [Acetitomaculum ruminis]SFA72215.1 redox-sensing transcriptional repressor [Acetitomaculum ruminis DSM 5522]
MADRDISQAVIRRLPRYYRYLGELVDDEIERISSGELSDKMNVTASQIRQDLNNFGGFGQQGYGYNVKYLYNEIGKILGLDNIHNIVIVGAGKLGMAIANFPSFNNRGFITKALFDINKDVIGSNVHGAPVLHIDALVKFINENDIDIAVLTVPRQGADEVTSLLLKSNIKAIWNFTNKDLVVPENVSVENVHLLDSLMQLSYTITSR